MDNVTPAPRPISAVDSINPAFSDTGRILFKPFRWSRWWRMGLLALATGELASGFSCNFNIPAGFPKDGNNGQDHLLAGNTFPGLPQLGHIDPALIATLVTVLVIGAIVLVIVHAYVSSVLRFVLFDAVAAEQFALLEGWKRRHPQGLRFFLFLIVYGMLSLTGLLLIVGIPLYLTLQARSIGAGAPVLAWLAAAPFLMIYFLVLIVFFIFVKDFAVPVMALEDLSAMEAIQRVWKMLKGEPGNYAGYAGMKLLLAIAAGIGFSIVQFVVILVVMVPLVVVGVAVGISAPQIFKNPGVLAGLITVGIVFIFIMAYVLAVIGSPVTVFFQSYALEFFGSRYLPLWQVMHPAPPMPPPAAPPPLPTAPSDGAPAM